MTIIEFILCPLLIVMMVWGLIEPLFKRNRD